MRPITHDLLTREVTAWHQQGFIDRPLLETLLPRYESSGRFLAALLKWLGLFAIFQLGWRCSPSSPCPRNRPWWRRCC